LLKNFKNISLIVICLLSGLAAGCGLFNTRTPQEPITVRSTYVPPTSPAIVISNLTYSIEEKNSTNYINCLSPDNYVYVPDSKSLSLYGQIFQNWDLNSENFYFQNLISQTNANASSNLFLSNPSLNQITPDSAIYSAEYIVVFQHNKTNVPKSAEGNLRFTLKADLSNFFYIEKWEDYRQNDTDFTWSELKANFSN
jgi:hypothetical protein